MLWTTQSERNGKLIVLNKRFKKIRNVFYYRYHKRTYVGLPKRTRIDPSNLNPSILNILHKFDNFISKYNIERFYYIRCLASQNIKITGEIFFVRNCLLHYKYNKKKKTFIKENAVDYWEDIFYRPNKNAILCNHYYSPITKMLSFLTSKCNFTIKRRIQYS